MPFKLRVKQLNETSLRLEWTGESLTNDENLRFRIVFGRSRDDLSNSATPRLKVLQPTRNLLTLTKLNAGETYWFLLEIGTDQGGYQAASDPIWLRLETGTGGKVPDPPTVIYVYSYKEGIIIGVCLAVVVLVVCLLIICCCRNR